MKFDINGALMEICVGREDIKQFFIEELGHFKSGRNNHTNIKIVFKKKIRGCSESEMVGNEGESTPYGLILKIKQRTKIEIPYQDVGQRIIVNCEEGINLSSFFHDILEPLIHYRLLGKKKALVHCSSLVYKKRGLLLFGYGGSGRTTVLLEFLRNGASFVSDDHTIISSDGTFFSLSRKVTLENNKRIGTYGKNHFEAFPEFIYKISRNFTQRIHLWVKVGLSRILSLISKNIGVQKCKIGKILLNTMYARIKIQKRVLISQLFPRIQSVPSASCTCLFSLVRHSGKETEIVQEDADQIVEEMIITNMMEHMRFLRNYEMFKFIFPRIKSKVIEEREALERKIFAKFLQSKKIIRVKVPFDFSPADLVNQMIRLL
ncbi:MAG: hypothetical protein ACFFCW_05825 [Candidatus Hodarchaeota archaeon]